MAGKTAVFNGNEVILEETDWYLLDLFRLWWRYGISFIRLQMWVEEIMEKFMRWARNIKHPWCLIESGYGAAKLFFSNMSCSVWPHEGLEYIIFFHSSLLLFLFVT